MLPVQAAWASGLRAEPSSLPGMRSRRWGDGPFGGGESLRGGARRAIGLVVQALGRACGPCVIWPPENSFNEPVAPVAWTLQLSP